MLLVIIHDLIHLRCLHKQECYIIVNSKSNDLENAMHTKHCSAL